jgi:hypothetical protein
MAPAGGYQAPKNPATFSGPGKYSQRTDGGVMDSKTQGAPRVTGQAYGENKELNALQSGAPLAASNVEIPKSNPLDVNALKGIVNQSGIAPLSAPTQRPEEPITVGSPFGDGPGPEILNDIIPVIDTTSVKQSDAVAQQIREAYSAFPSPALYDLVRKLEQEGR